MGKLVSLEEYKASKERLKLIKRIVKMAALFDYGCPDYRENLLDRYLDSIGAAELGIKIDTRKYYLVRDWYMLLSDHVELTEFMEDLLGT